MKKYGISEVALNGYSPELVAVAIGQFDREVASQIIQLLQWGGFYIRDIKRIGSVIQITLENCPMYEDEEPKRIILDTIDTIEALGEYL